MAFDSSEYDDRDLRMANTILGEMLDGVKQARIGVLEKKEDITPNQAFQLATEIKIIENIKQTALEEMDIRELDRSEETNENNNISP